MGGMKLQASPVPTMAALLSQAHAALAAGRMDEAKELAQAALRRVPQSREALGIGAMVDLQSGRLAEAAAAFRQVLVLLRGSGTATPSMLAQALHHLATALDQSGDVAGAEAAYREALALQPDRADTLESCGCLLRRLGRLDEAVSQHRLAVARHPLRAESAYALACTLAQCGALEEAVNWHRRAAELDPRMRSLNLALGNHG